MGIVAKARTQALARDKRLDGAESIGTPYLFTAIEKLEEYLSFVSTRNLSDSYIDGN